MAIGDNDNSDDDNLTDVSGISDLDLEDESDIEDNDDLDDIEWSDEMPEDAFYDHPQFTGPPRGPNKPVRTYLECIQLYLSTGVMNLIVAETNRVIVSKGTKSNRQGQEVEPKLLTVEEL